MATENTAIRSLEHTPTWALATVCFIFISFSIALEHSINLLAKWLKKRRKHALTDAVEKMKSELMLLGFMPLLLAGSQSPISDICVPAKIAEIMLPCGNKQAVKSKITKVQAYGHQDWESKSPSGNFLSVNGDILWKLHGRLVNEESGAAASGPCSSEGKVSLMTLKGMRQLQQFIFVLAVMQIVYSALTMAFARAKINRWKAWEKESQTTEYQVTHDPERFRLTRQTTFARRHVSSCTETSVQLWIKCFFRQFFNPVAKVDYLTLRHGFISAHFPGRRSNFNFQEYIERSLDEDLKIAVSISPLMWLIVVIFMLVNVHGWQVFLWLSFVPILLVLILGTKLEVIVARMALQINNQNTVIRGTPLVQLNDELFWFGRPRSVLTLVHFALFTNAFELAFFIWVSIQFGLDSCFHEHTAVIITRIVLPITVQVLCSYITLPLYALVTQMGSQYKSPVLGDQIAKILKQWHGEVRERRNKQELQQSPRGSLPTKSNSITGSPADEFPSFPRPSLASSDSIQLFNRGEITEEHDKTVKVEAGPFHGPSQPIILGNPMQKKGRLQRLHGPES